MHALVLAAVAAGALALSEAPDLPQALQSADPLVRATAARMVATRAERDALPAVRAAFATETDLDAAREELRALVMTGEDADIELASKALTRFPEGMQYVFGDALARTGPERAIDLAFRYQTKGFSFTQALWGRPDYATATAARLLGAHKEDQWAALLAALREASLELAPNVASIALRSENERIRVDTLWHYVAIGHVLSLPDAPANASVRELFAREVLARIGGAKPKEDPRFLGWLATPEAASDFQAALPRLTRAEARQQKAKERELAKTAAPPALPSALPPGLAPALLAAAQCSDAWLGFASVNIDGSGRVLGNDVSAVKTSDACRRVLSAMIALSLVTPRSLNVPRVSNGVLTVNAARRTPCLDEAPVTSFGGTLTRIGGTVKAPKAIERAEPELKSRPARGTITFIKVDAVISSTGCVREVRILQPAPVGDWNAAAVESLSKWKFEPGLLNGIPVDVLFNLTFSIRGQ